MESPACEGTHGLRLPDLLRRVCFLKPGYCRSWEGFGGRNRSRILPSIRQASCHRGVTGLTPGVLAIVALLSEGTEPRCRHVDPSLSARRHDLECDCLQLDISFVAHEVYVPTTFIDESCSCWVRRRCTRRVVSVIDGRRAGFHGHNARARMRVPAAMTSGRHPVTHDVDV
jgi:hypothetical protein